MVNSADPNQLASPGLDLHCLQRQDISGFSRTRVNVHKIKFTFYAWYSSYIPIARNGDLDIITRWNTLSAEPEIFLFS